MQLFYSHKFLHKNHTLHGEE